MHDLRDGLGIFAVHVEDRTLQHLRDVGGIDGRARFVGRCREPDLVVHDDVERAADLVAFELAQVQRLLDDAFAGERGVAVNQDAPAPCSRSEVAEPILLRPHAPERHRVDEFQMAGVEAQATRWTLPLAASDRGCSRGDTSRRRGRA